MSVKLAKPENPVETLVRSQMEELEEMVGGRHNLITGLLASDDHRANRLATALQKADNADKNIYDVCRSVNMSLEEALRCFSKGEIFKSTIETFLALSEGLPAVMQQSVEVAKSHGPDGYKDRELLFKLSGLLKDGGGINVNLNQKISTNVGGQGFEKLVSSEIGGVNIYDSPFSEGEIIDVEENE